MDSRNDDELESKVIEDPVKLTITRAAFENCSEYKKNILRQIRKRVAVAEFVNDTSALNNYVNQVPQTLVWHFSAEEFLKVTKEYPWLLDSNLGEPRD